MTIFNKIAASTAIVAVVLGVFASTLPQYAGALNAPRCVLNTIVQPFNNGGTTLSWKVYDAHTITLSGVGTVQDADSIVVYPTSTQTYTLTATGNGGVDTCTATVQAVSTNQPFTNTYGTFGTHTSGSETCTVSVSPDYVVPGGSAVLTWNVGSAYRVTIDNGIGSVSNTGTKVVPYSPTPRTYTITAENTNGSQRACSATVRPAVGGTPTFTQGVRIPGVFVVQTPGVTLPTTPAPVVHTQAPRVYTQAPTVTATYTRPTVQYVALSQVPYTGPEDTGYIASLVSVLLGSMLLMLVWRREFAHVLGSFSPTDNDDHEVAREEATA